MESTWRSLEGPKKTLAMLQLGLPVVSTFMGAQLLIEGESRASRRITDEQDTTPFADQVVHFPVAEEDTISDRPHVQEPLATRAPTWSTFLCKKTTSSLQQQQQLGHRQSLSHHKTRSRQRARKHGISSALQQYVGADMPCRRQAAGTTNEDT